MAYEPPYKLSRAALRDRFGSRRIDASAPQSARDATPSGRAALLRQRGASRTQIDQEENDLWREIFPADAATRPLTAMQQNKVMSSPLVPNRMPGTMARFQPRGLPTVQQPEMLAALPVSGSPLATPFQNDMDAVFGNIPFFRKPRPYLGTALSDAAEFLA